MNNKKQIVVTTLFLLAMNFSSSADIHTPKNFTEILQERTNRNWNPTFVNSLENRLHVVFIESGGSYCLKVNELIKGPIGLGNVDSLKNGTATYGDALRSMFQVLDLNIASLSNNDISGIVTIHPELASYYALDIQANGLLTVRDKSSFYHSEQDTSAYLVFAIDNETGETVYIQAIERKIYNNISQTYENDSNWSPYQWISINSDQTVSLVGDISDATEWSIADANGLIDVSVQIGSDFNPQSTDWKTNSFAAYPTNPNTGELSAWDYDESPIKMDNFSNNLDQDYLNQLGDSETADIASQNVLNIIAQNLINLDQSLRYTPETYIAFRKGLLGNAFESVDLYNSKLGGRTVEHVYFTSSFDDNGAYHPFMVIATHNAPSGPQFLIDVARPPGDNCCEGGYDEQNVTRNAVLEQKLIKIPLRDYGLVNSFTDNDLTEYGSLALDQNLDEEDWTVDNHASVSSTGIAVDGVIMYPASNNVLIYASLAAEITSTGIHVGRGMGFHYHSDGHGFNSNGINLYNNMDYEERSHPPIIGFVFDGIALFGKYQDDSNLMDGANETVDEFGGHSHDDYEYHYHAHSKTVEQQAGPNTYTFEQNYLQKGAFRGNINDIPGFFNVNTNQFMDSELKKYVGGTGTSQLSLVKPINLYPSIFDLYQNYPNPFNPVTTIRYDLHQSALVNISVYNMNGKLVNNLINEQQNPGYKLIKWDSKNYNGVQVSAGVYILKIKTEVYTESKKMVLLK